MYQKINIVNSKIRTRIKNKKWIMSEVNNTVKFGQSDDNKIHQNENMSWGTQRSVIPLSVNELTFWKNEKNDQVIFRQKSQ